MAVHVTPYLPLVTVAGAQGANDALTNKANFSSLPRSGTITAVKVIDLGRSTGINLDVALFSADFTQTTINAAWDPSDTDILNMIGVVLVDTWSAFADSCMGFEANVALPYFAPEGKIYTQLITRGTPTPASTADMFLSLAILI